MNSYINALKQYAVFNGRTGRRDFWMFTLFNVLVSLIFSVIDIMIFGGSFDDPNVFSSLYSLAVLLPSIGISIRRLHDIGKSGWLVLLNFIPCIGWFVLIYFYVQPGDLETNEYGPVPIPAAS